MPGVTPRRTAVAPAAVLLLLTLAGCGEASSQAAGSTLQIADGQPTVLDRVECQRDVRVQGDPEAIGLLGQSDLSVTATGQGEAGAITLTFDRIRTGQDLLSDVVSLSLGGGDDHPQQDLLAVGSDLETPRGWDVQAAIDGDVVTGTATMEGRNEAGTPVQITFDLHCP